MYLKLMNKSTVDTHYAKFWKKVQTDWPEKTWAIGNAFTTSQKKKKTRKKEKVYMCTYNTQGNLAWLLYWYHFWLTCSTSAQYPPIVSLHNLQNSLFHIFKWNWLHIGICRTSLLRCWGSEVIHHFLQFKQKVVLKLRPLNPKGNTVNN